MNVDAELRMVQALERIAIALEQDVASPSMDYHPFDDDGHSTINKRRAQAGLPPLPE